MIMEFFLTIIEFLVSFIFEMLPGMILAVPAIGWIEAFVSPFYDFSYLLVAIGVFSATVATYYNVKIVIFIIKLIRG